MTTKPKILGYGLLHQSGWVVKFATEREANEYAAKHGDPFGLRPVLKLISAKEYAEMCRSKP